MGKVKRKVALFWCLICNSTQTTLLKIGEHRFCTTCVEKLRQGHRVPGKQGGFFYLDKTFCIVFEAPEPEEEVKEEAKAVETVEETKKDV